MTQTKAELLETKHQGDIRLGDANSSHYVGFKAPATVSSSLVWTLPAADGSANQFLKTNASGVLSWGTVDTSTLMPLGGGTFTGNVTSNDNVEARFGTGADLKIFHNATHSFIQHTYSSGNFFIESAANIAFKVATNESALNLNSNGSVELFHDNVKTFETLQNGVRILGSEGNYAYLHLWEDEGDDNADKWRMEVAGGSFKLANYSTGSWVNGLIFDGSNNATFAGNLTVNGTTTTVDSVTLSVKDKNIEMGVVSSPSDTTADGGGITLKGASDKTFNWVNSTDAWTSSEHIKVASGKTFIGDGSTLTALNATNLGSGTVPTARLGSGTANSGTFLAGNNTWQAISSAPEITGTASGSITAEKAVIANGSGTLAQVAITPASVGSDIAVSSTNQNYHRLLHWTGDKYIYGRKDPAINGVYLQVVTISGNSLSYGTQVSISTTQNNYMEPWSMIINYAKDKLYVLNQYNTSGHMYHWTFPISGTTIGSASSSGIVNNSGPMGNMAHLKQANGEISYFYKRGQNSTMAFRGQMNGGGPTTMISSVTNAWGNFTSCYVPWIDKNIIFYRNSSAEGFLRIINMNSSGGYQSMGNSYQIASGGWGDNLYNTWSLATPSFAVDTVNERVAFFYLKNNDQGDQGIHYRILSNIQAGGSITVGAKQTITTSTGTAIHADYDSANDQFIMVWNDTSDSDKGKMFKGTSATPALTNTSTSTFQSSIDIYDENDRTMAFAMGSNNGAQGLIVYTDDTNSNRRTFNIYNGAATNLTSENFVGFAKSGVSNGQTATVKVTGNTSTQSSLTFGQKYYVQSDGSVGLSPVSGKNVEAGVALSSTKLLIKG